MMATANTAMAALTDETAAAPPIIWVGGDRRQDLAVLSIESTGPTDERSATIALRRAASALEPAERHRLEALAGQSVRIAQPVALGGGSSALFELFTGRLGNSATTLAGTVDRFQLRAPCDWTRQLDTVVDGRDEPLTFADAVAQLNTSAGLGLSMTRLGAAAQRQRVAPWVRRCGGDVLAELLGEVGAFVDRTEGGRRSILSADAGRPCSLPGAFTEVRNSAAAHRPTRMHAVGAPQVVESTFELLPAWDGSLEAEPDAMYSMSTSVDFDTYANVFRLWLLNEDAALGEPAYDLTALFDAGAPVDPTSLRFGLSLTQDGASRSIGTVVEWSSDSGTTWRRYGGGVEVLPDRAGVYFNDDLLDATLLAAARAGTACVRITAALTSPRATELTRWRGNPFAGEFSQERFDLRWQFAWRRVAPTSRFAPDVAAGTRNADQVDDRPEMARWLARRARMAAAVGGQTHIGVPLAIGVRVGDLISLPTDRSVLPTRVVTGITHDWSTHQTKLQLQPIGGRA